MNKFIILLSLLVALPICNINAATPKASSDNVQVQKTSNVNIDDILDRISDIDGVSVVFVNGNMSKMDKHVGDYNLNGVIKATNIISIEEPKQIKLVKPMLKEIRNANNLELMTRVKDDGDLTEIYIQKKGDKIYRWIMITTEEDEISIINITGDFTLGENSNM